MSQDSKFLQPIPYREDPKITSTKTLKATNLNVLRSSYSIQSWICLGAVLQATLFATLKPSYAALPALCYTIYTIISLNYATFVPIAADPNVLYSRTTGLVPSETGELHSGVDGEKIAVLHLIVKNYHPLGGLAPGMKEMGTVSGPMFRDLETPEARIKYGFLGRDTFLHASSPVPASNGTLQVMYFRSMDGVRAFANSEIHRKGMTWYHNFIKDQGLQNKHIGIFHEVFEAPAGSWEGVGLNIERLGLAKAKATLDDGTVVSTLVDAKGRLAGARGRTS